MRKFVHQAIDEEQQMENFSFYWQLRYLTAAPGAMCAWMERAENLRPTEG